MVSRSIWRSDRFCALGNHRDKLAYFYLLTCEHQTGTGCFRLPDGYAIADLGWQMPEYQESKQACITAGLIDVDPATQEILIEKWLQNNPPTNQKHAAGVAAMISNVESDRLREKLENEFAQVHQPTERMRDDGSYLTNSAFMQGRR